MEKNLQIKQLIEKGCIKQAIEQALYYSKENILNDKFADQVILQSSKFNNIERSLSNSTISVVDFDIRKIQIANELLAIIDQIRDLNEAVTQGKEVPLFEAKLIFIGSGYVGKTSLINKILDGKFNKNEMKTEGISIRDWRVKGKNEIDIHIWDFGGQEIMHATHKFFMTHDSVYVVVITPREEDRYGETELNYWLKLVQSFAPDSPIIVAINKCELHIHGIDKSSFLINYPNILSFIETSCAKNIGIDHLVNDIEIAIQKLPHLGKPIPQSYFSIKNRLSKIKTDFISYSEYMKICREVEPDFKEDSMSALVSLLHNLGIILNFREEIELEQTQVMNPEWVTQAVYKIINAPILPLQKGVISVDELSKILDKDRFPRNQHLFLVSLMEKFELCYYLPDNKRTIFIPNAFNAERPQKLEWDFSNTLQFEYHYDVLPNSIMSRLIVKLHRFIVDEKCWRDGIIIKYEELLAFIFIDRIGLKLSISIKGGNKKKELLGIISSYLDDIHHSFKALRIIQRIPYEGIIIDYEDLISCQEQREEELYIPKLRKRINVSELLESVNIIHRRETSNTKFYSPIPYSKKTIIFFASNPTDTGQLRLGTEVREITESLLLSKHREKFELIQVSSTRPKDLNRSVLTNRPHIVHFSGHGKKDYSYFHNLDSTKIGSEGGIVFETDNGNSKVVNAQALGNLFKLFANIVECVVLNACYSEAQAIHIVQHIRYVIGMSYSISDKAATIFSTAFYGAIGAGTDIEFAFDYAKNAIQLEGLDENDIPKLLKR